MVYKYLNFRQNCGETKKLWLKSIKTTYATIKGLGMRVYLKKVSYICGNMAKKLQDKYI